MGKIFICMVLNRKNTVVIILIMLFVFTSGYKGVTRSNCLYKKWKAVIKRDGKAIFCQYFNTPELAAIAYNEAATKFHGEFAVLNVIPKNKDPRLKKSLQ